ncbi:hypothetical protein N7463_001314 [Penicillium fimorum]|uniref:2-oxoadipate dioxygenase/decarboxylase n=1 Tax=Penicillium fimorum TaxID=1882269 RepID=A0A9W9Y656_9EURO|nr:hypothetical protein N7463_001314 [Penicillium fimorum]
MSHHSWNADELRTKFTHALSDMYRAEVPLYGTLLDIVRHVDRSVLDGQGKDLEELPIRHNIERHGAIRLGTANELRLIKRLFKIFGMYPVGYYDLHVVGFPLHGTAFRPIDQLSLMNNPFRVFATVLRTELVSTEIRSMAEKTLEMRNLFSPRLLEIIQNAEAGKGMTSQDADDLILESLKIFKWHSQSTVAFDEYMTLKEAHPMIADIVCFPSVHINHLTPRTLDIDLVQEEMIKHNMPTKERIEGPPRRKCSILLRQTSFKALEERVRFYSSGQAYVDGTHTARFGEVEQRGAAVTRKGRNLYDQLLSVAMKEAANISLQFPDFEKILSTSFSNFPDDWSELRKQGLVYFHYKVTSKGRQYSQRWLGQRDARVKMEELISLGLVEVNPITYEDFLPFSAAGIFKSNIGNGPAAPEFLVNESNLNGLEKALGCKVRDEFELYQQLQDSSVKECACALGLDDIIMQ